MPRPPTRARSVALVVAAVVALSACSGTSQLAFRVDKRLHWQGPGDRELVTLPLSVRWKMDDFRGSFAAFVDRAPVRPGQTLDAVAGDDRACRRDPRCPDAEYLTLRQVYTTTDPVLRLEHVAPLANNRSKTQLHRVTIVLLDASGRRVGESAWSRDFRLKRETF